jgi:hypothetical protein
MRTISLRDEFMSFAQEELSLLEGSYGVVTCMQRELDVSSMYRPGWVLFRTAGGFMNSVTPEFRDALKEQANWVVLSHTGCGAAKVVEAAIKDKSTVAADVYEALVKPMELHNCKTCTEVEQKNPGIVAETIQKVSGEMGLAKKNIITGCIDTPKLTESHNGLALVITTPLRCKYSELEIDAADPRTYYIHNSLFSTEPDIRVAVEKIGVRSIKVISQNIAEDAKIANFVDYLKADVFLAKMGVKIESPVLSTNRPWQIHVPTQPQPASQKTTRATL